MMCIFSDAAPYGSQTGLADWTHTSYVTHDCVTVPSLVKYNYWHRTFITIPFGLRLRQRSNNQCQYLAADSLLVMPQRTMY